MSLRDRPRFIRNAQPTPKPVPKLAAVPEPRKPEPVEEVLVRPRLRLVVDWRTRDDCPTCAAQRDEHGRLPIGLCGPTCLMARPR